MPRLMVLVVLVLMVVLIVVTALDLLSAATTLTPQNASASAFSFFPKGFRQNQGPATCFTDRGRGA